jgi:hypothetical protein
MKLYIASIFYARSRSKGAVLPDRRSAEQKDRAAACTLPANQYGQRRDPITTRWNFRTDRWCCSRAFARASVVLQLPIAAHPASAEEAVKREIREPSLLV